MMGGAVYVKGWGKKPDSKLIEREKDVQKQMGTPLPNKDMPEPLLLAEINLRNAAIRSIACNDVEIRAWQSGHRYRLSGKLHYEKPNRFRMEISSVLGKEVDIGSDDKLFWYWSRRDPNPGVHWAKHEDFAKTRLKTPFNPVFMRATLGVDALPLSNATVVENDRDLMLIYRRTNTTGHPVLYSVFINKGRKQVEGFLITDGNSGKTLAACEIQEWSGDMPVKILYTWFEEDKVLLIRYNKPQMNGIIGSDKWQMPNNAPKRDMAEERK
jgi:hypothetical protein